MSFWLVVAGEDRMFLVEVAAIQKPSKKTQQDGVMEMRSL